MKKHKFKLALGLLVVALIFVGRFSTAYPRNHEVESFITYFDNLTDDLIQAMEAGTLDKTQAVRQMLALEKANFKEKLNSLGAIKPHQVSREMIGKLQECIRKNGIKMDEIFAKKREIILADPHYWEEIKTLRNEYRALLN